jgi:hypothetical protein
MVSHWSATSLIYVINKLNKLQDASAPTRYCSWNATFDIYKVITVIDENGHNHYQFINVTDKGIVSAKKEANSLNKRIEELEKANYELGEQVAERGAVANRLLDENNSLKAKVEDLEKALDDQKKLNETFNTTIVRYRNEKRDMDKEFKELFSIRNSLAEVIFAIRNAIYNNDSDAFRCIENRMKFDADFNSDPFMAGVKENIKDICFGEKKNIANHELKDGEIAKLAEKIEKLKSQFNSMYGYDVMITGGRCCGKQLMADILNGKKIPISKDKYDSILTSLKLIDISYEGVYGTTIRISPKPKPTWLPGLMTEIKNLTK